MIQLHPSSTGQEVGSDNDDNDGDEDDEDDDGDVAGGHIQPRLSFFNPQSPKASIPGDRNE